LRTLVTIALYNEEGSLPDLLERERRFLASGERIDVLYVDDGSEDATPAILRAAGAFCVRHDINLGQGIACNTGMLAAINLGYDVVVTMDGDGQHDFADVPRLVEALRSPEVDIAVGSRVLGATHSDAALARRLFLPHVTWVVNRLSGYRITDAMCGLRAYKVASLRWIIDDLSRLLENEYSAAELFMRFGKAGLKMAEVPVTLRNRVCGSSRKGMVNYGIGIMMAIARTLLDGRYWRR
jgi:glycosyltransferase involved in cell wall biosynthesis